MNKAAHIKNYIEREITILKSTLGQCIKMDISVIQRTLRRLDTIEIVEDESNYVIVGVPLIRKHNSLREGKITLHIQLKDFIKEHKRILYHELMHVISTGDLEKLSGNVYVQKMGVCYVAYQLEDGGLSTKAYMQQKLLNEILTNFAAEFFLKASREGLSDSFKNVLAKMHIHDVLEVEELVYAYISNDVLRAQEFIQQQLGFEQIEDFKRACILDNM